MLRWRGLCRRLVIWWSYQPRVRPVENRLCDNECRMSPDMVQQATNGNSIEHNRIRVHSSISSNDRSNTIHEFDGRSRRSFSSSQSKTSCIRVAESSKFTPRTKHIAIKYHHFRKQVADKTISILPIDTKDQLADIFMKPLDRVIFRKLRLPIMGW